jgi:iron(III) transport system ATP-binding protein
MVNVKLKGVSKDFGTFRAVEDINFEVREGEILTLLGPSGCGKSTTLRMIAGFLFPDEGRIFFGDVDVSDLPPQKRNTAMVFQNYALWPHMSVRKNVEFGLTIRKTPKEEKTKAVNQALKMVHLQDIAEKMPNKLSGGQQQRVAVARALVVNPDVLLLDEPLSNLDAKLRLETRQEIRDLVKELNLTTIFVTHDQSEALSISDRIAVLDTGYLRQVGSPEQIWVNPTSAFVGSFIGEANTIELEVGDIQKDFVTLKVPSNDGKNFDLLKSSYFLGIEEQGQKVKVVIRPEVIKIHTEVTNQENIATGVVNSVLFFGSYTYVQVILGGSIPLVIHAPINTKLERNQEIFLEIRPDVLKSFGPKNY